MGWINAGRGTPRPFYARAAISLLNTLFLQTARKKNPEKKSIAPHSRSLSLSLCQRAAKRKNAEDTRTFLKKEKEKGGFPKKYQSTWLRMRLKRFPLAGAGEASVFGQGSERENE